MFRCSPLPLGGRGWERVSRRDGPLPGFARRFRWRESGPPPGLPRKRGRRLRATASGSRPVSPPVRCGGRSRSSVPPSRQRAGRCVPVSRAIARACARGCGRAYRGGAVRARDCPRETAHAPRPSVPAGVFFAAPAIAFCRNAERRPRKPPLSTFILHHIEKCQARNETKIELAAIFPLNPGCASRKPRYDPGEKCGSASHAGNPPKTP